jgi:hypothetical protein
MHVRRERVNLRSRVNISKLFEFEKKLNAAPDAGEDDLDFNIDSNFMDNLNENINLYISREEIFDCIKKLKNDKASGEDGIINEYIKSTAHQFINIYEKLFNLIFDCGIIPESWVIVKIKPIYKNKGDSSEPKNYRPITILSCLGKLFTSVLCNRLKICTASTLLMLSFLLGLHMLDAYSRLGRTKVV